MVAHELSCCDGARGEVPLQGQLACDVESTPWPTWVSLGGGHVAGRCRCGYRCAPAATPSAINGQPMCTRVVGPLPF